MLSVSTPALCGEGRAFPFPAAAAVAQPELLLVRWQAEFERGMQGSQALPVKPLKTASSLGRERYDLFPLHLHPKATGVLLTSHQKWLTTDSSSGNECARGPGGRPQCAGLTPRAAQLRVPVQGPIPRLPGPSALGKSCLSGKTWGKLSMASGCQGGWHTGNSAQCPEDKVLIVCNEQLGTLRPGDGRDA